MIKFQPKPESREGKNRFRGDHPCWICGRELKNRHLWIHVVEGGSHLAKPDEKQTWSDNGDMYWFPIGADCLKAYPEIKEYVYRDKQ